MATKPKNPPSTRPIWPNAGVESWYRQRLESLVRDVRDTVDKAVRDAWRSADDLGELGFANDAAPVWAAGIMFRMPDGRVLLCHRTDGEGWAWPAGGIEPSEDPEGAAIREAGEETGIGWPGMPLQLLEVREARGVRFFTYTADVPAHCRVFLNSEHDAFQWVTPEYALRFLHLHPGVRTTLAFQSPAPAWSDRQVMLANDAKPTGPELLRRALEKWGAIWRGRLDDLSLDLSTKFADKNFSATQAQMKAAFAAKGFTVKFAPTVASKAAYQAMVAENVNLIKSIPEQYLKDVQTQVWQAVMKGSDLGTLSKNLQNRYEIAHRRAALIARDQNAKAKAIIENTRRKEMGVTEAIWQHSTAGKEPRPTHVAMDGKRYKLDTGMWDSDEGEHVWPGQLINCRCTSRAVLPGFD